MNDIKLRKLLFLKAIGYKFINTQTLENIAFYKDLDELNASVKSCLLCHIKNSCKNSFVARAPKDFKVMFVNLVQNSQDFSWFDELIQSACGLSKSERYDTYVLRCQSENIKSEFLNACLPYLFEEIRLLSPKIIVALGANVFKCFYPKQDISGLRGGFVKFENSLLLPTFSPEYLAKNPSKKEQFVNDLEKIKELV
ncbi:MAG: uracil-DNA glycosylase [Campylobacter sp.]|nr:uracil-DNA glycosylase [Campylobacter sp.]